MVKIRLSPYCVLNYNSDVEADEDNDISAYEEFIRIECLKENVQPTVIVRKSRVDMDGRCIVNISILVSITKRYKYREHDVTITRTETITYELHGDKLYKAYYNITRFLNQKLAR